MMKIFLSSPMVFITANRSMWILRAIGLAVCAALVLGCPTSRAFAAIIGTGDVNPLDPNTWTSSTTGYIGVSASGTVSVDAGSLLRSDNGYLGYNSGSQGTVMVTDTGSKWTNSSSLYIGYRGSGTMNIEAGGEVSNYYAYLGYDPDSQGTVMVTGTGSKWTTIHSLFIGKDGSGTLTVSDGGTVIINRELYASLTSLLGNGTISASGGVLDADIVFDATHGALSIIAFGTGGTLNLTQSTNYALGAGYKSQGKLSIVGGNAVASAFGYLGYHSGSLGTATVTGPGSKWTTSDALHIGFRGSGILNIEAGGEVSNSEVLLGTSAGSTGTAKMSGAGSKWTSGSFIVGEYGSGTLSIEAGGQVSTNSSYLGNYAGSQGAATVAGTGSKWTNSSSLYVGNSGSGTLNVEMGGQVSSTNGYLGSSSGAQGMGTVAGTGSKWTMSSSLIVGDRGRGTLDVEAGGTVSNIDGYLGYSYGSEGTVTVTGKDSMWTNSGALYVGRYGRGTLNIEAGGVVSNTYGYLGYEWSQGTATVTGTGSKWSCDVLYVGNFGSSGTLTVSDAGTVIVNKGILTSLSSLFGNGSISTNGGVLDADLVFDAAHGTQNIIPFGTGGSLNFATSASGGLGVGYKGQGTLRISEGTMIASSWNYLGYHSGSLGTATVTGPGSKWTTSAALHIGSRGSGILNIEAGGEVSNSGVLLGTSAGSTGTAKMSGAGSKWTSGSFIVGVYGSGTLSIEAGGQVSTNSSWLGEYAGSQGTVTVSGIGSKWTGGAFDIGQSGIGTLNIVAGGEVSNTGSSIGYYSGSQGTVSVIGSGSKWIISDFLFVGKGGSGKLTVSDGGTVIVNRELFASVRSFLGNGTVSAKGGVVDADIVFDAAHGLQSVSAFGTGGTLNFTQSVSSVLGVGYKSQGNLSISEGTAVNSSTGYLGYYAGSQGTATVTGIGSKWTSNGVLYVGYDGSGTLNIAAGGEVNNTGSYLGYYIGSQGTATVTGTGSKWTMSGSFYVGRYGRGILNIEAGGKIVNTDSYLGYNWDSQDTATVTGIGSKWTSNGVLYVGYDGSGTLNIAAGGEVNNIDSYIGTDSYLGYDVGSQGTAMVTGIGSKWTTSGSLYIGKSGNGTLTIGSTTVGGGLVTSKNLILASSLGSKSVCNINNGGMIRTGKISKGSGSATFNWNDGTIRNFNASTNLTITSNVVLKLAANGTHTFEIDAGRIGTIDAVLSDATSGGTLSKIGMGLLRLNAVNKYSGSTTISGGTLALGSSGSLASSLIEVGSGATFDVSAKSGGFSLGAGKTLMGSGTIVGDLSISGIHAPGSLGAGSLTGMETVKGNYAMLGELKMDLMGTTVGTGYDQVLLPVNGTTNYNATLGGTLALDWTGMTGAMDASKLWILRNDTAGTLSGMFENYGNGAALGMHDGREWFLWYGADAASGNLSGGNDVVVAAVPEPGMMVLMGMGLAGILGWRWKRRR